jgi:NitT/TauT family transport system substrate-binding protein
MQIVQTRRYFLSGAALVGAGGLFRAPVATGAEGPALETTTLRLTRTPSLCTAPQYVAEELLHTEGFSDIRYIDTASATESANAIGGGQADLSFDFVSPFIIGIDSGQPITVLAGAMSGCFELFVKEGIKTVADLKGKKVGLRSLGATPHVLLSIIAAEVGLDPVKDIEWVVNPKSSPIELFVNGKVDAFVGNPPESLDLRAQRIGHVIVKTSVDRPWSQYFCCMLAGSRDYTRRNPVATKRALRAILKATDLCATEPSRASRRIVDRGFLPRYDYVLQTLNENGYDKWREYDAEDTIRFYSLRLHEVGFVKSSPQKIIAEGTDWRFLNELKRELKA